MALDPSIPLQTKVPDTMGTLASLTNLQTARVGLQRQQMAQQQDSIDLQERQGVQGVLSNIKKYQDSAGNVDFNKLVPDIMSVAPTTGSEVLGKVAQAQTAATNAHAQVNALDAQSRKTVANYIYAMKGQDPQTAAKMVGDLKTSFPGLSGAVDYFQNYVIGPHMNDQKSFDSAVDSAGKFVQEAPTQQEMNTPSGVAVSDNQTSRVVSTKPGTTVPQGATVPGTEVTLKPGPTTATVDQSGTPGIIGASQADFSGLQGPGRTAALADIASRNPDAQNRQEAANALAGRAQGFIPQGLPPGQAQNIANNVDEMNRHFASLQDQSTGNQLQQGLIQNIKALAPGAATGTGAGRKAFIDGLLAAMHVPGTGNEAKDTDLLEKNMAQLGLATPASSDAMRAIVTAARPHGTMQEGALIEAADQLSGQIKANVAIRNALSSYKMMGDTQGYQSAREKIEKIADPRAFQFESAPPDEQRKMVAKMSPEDRAQLRDKIKQLIDMGLMK